MDESNDVYGINRPDEELESGEDEDEDALPCASLADCFQFDPLLKDESTRRTMAEDEERRRRRRV